MSEPGTAGDMPAPGIAEKVLVQVVPVEPSREIGWGSSQVEAFRDRLRHAGVLVKTVDTPEGLETAVLHALQKVAKKTYIRVPKFPQPVFDKALADCKSDKSWVTVELHDVGHISMLDAPDRTSELILQGA